MARILGIDYGLKKTGLAVTDPLQIIVNPLETIATSNLKDYLKIYFAQEEVEKIVIGIPTHKDGTPTSLNEKIEKLVKFLRTTYPNIIVDFEDEMYSSKEAKAIILASGVKKSKRRDKTLIDKISAVIILQRYLKHI